MTERRRAGICIAATILLVIATRMAIIATSVNDLHTVTTEEFTVSEFSQDLRATPDAWRHPLRVYFHNIGSYLPENVQFHGVLLLNAVIVALLSIFTGVQFYNVHLAALFYVLVVYLCWALLIHRHFGFRALVFFSVLFVFAPDDYLRAQLFLRSSHGEGAALESVLFFLAFWRERGWERFLFPFAFGLFFFFYKGVALLAPVGLFVFWRRLRGWGERAAAVGLAALGVSPMIVYQLFFGFHSQVLRDGCRPEQHCSWFNFLSIHHWQLAAWKLPDTIAYNLEVPFLGKQPLSAFFLVAAVILVFSLAWDRQRTERLARPLLIAVLAFPVLVCLVLAFGGIGHGVRFYWPIYPLMMFVSAVALARIPKPLAITLAATLAITYAADLPRLIRPDNGAVFLRCRGLEYFEFSMPDPDVPTFAMRILRAPTEEIDFVNWWVDHCPDNAGFRVIYIAPPPPADTTYRARVAPLDRSECYLDRLLADARLTPVEAEAVGMTLAVRLKGNRVLLRRYLEGVAAPADLAQSIEKGFVNFEPDPIKRQCPQATP